MKIVSGTAASNVLIDSHDAGHHSYSFLDDFNMTDMVCIRVNLFSMLNIYSPLSDDIKVKSCWALVVFR